jgi:hypothetical protein
MLGVGAIEALYSSTWPGFLHQVIQDALIGGMTKQTLASMPRHSASIRMVGLTHRALGNERSAFRARVAAKSRKRAKAGAGHSLRGAIGRSARSSVSRQTRDDAKRDLAATWRRWLAMQGMMSRGTSRPTARPVPIR